MKPEEILKLADFWPTKILLTAAELEIFEVLDGPLGVVDVAERRGLSVEGTKRILNALVGMELLDLDSESRYSIKPEHAGALGTGPDTVLPSLKHRARLWELWTALPDIVRTGKHFDELSERKGREVERLKDFISAMAVGGRMAAKPAIDALDLGGVRSVLDVGGGPGIYAAAFCEILPDARVAILDRPGISEIARGFLKDTPYLDRVEIIEGDATDIDATDVVGPDGEGRFDLVFMSSLIHSMSPDEIKRLFANCVEWCSPGGRIAVKDGFLDDTRTQPSRASQFAINMLVATPDGNSYTWTETEGWLRDMCLSDGGPAILEISRIDAPVHFGGIIVARTAVG